MSQERSIDTSHFGDVHMFISVEPQLAGSCKEKIFLLSHAVNRRSSEIQGTELSKCLQAWPVYAGPCLRV